MSTEIKTRSKSPCKITVTDDDATNKLIINLVKKRSIVKGRHTKFVNHVNTFNVNENLPIQTQLDLKLRMQGAMNLFKEFSELQSQIEESILEVDLEEQLIQRESFESLYYNTLARAECLLKVGQVATSSKNSNSDCVKLPTISVPTFDGSYEHWLEFRDTFQSLIHNADHIHTIQKFHYLKSSLKGSAALVIDSLEFSAANYAVAWELLLTRYNNSRLLVHNHVKSLFNIQALSKESPESLRNLIDTILKNLRALKLLGEPVDHWDTLVVYIVTTKLDKVSEREWEHYKITSLKQAGNSTSNLKLDDLLTFLGDRADMLETLQVAHGQSNVTKRLVTSATNKFNCNVSTNYHNTNTSRTQIKKCILCKSNHPLYACQAFLNFNIQNKLEFVKTNQLCENCLRAGHRAIECRFGSCKKCNKKHNSLIHNESEARNIIHNDNKPVLAMHSSRGTHHTRDGPGAPSAYATNDPCVSEQCMRPVLLSTAIVEVKDKQNNYLFARALLDSGSERCIITRSLCDRLGLTFIQSTQEIRGIGNSITQSTRTCHINIKSHITSYAAQIQCFVLPQITSTWPAIPKQYAQFGIPDNLQLADPKFREPQNIDLLLGADIFWDLLCDGKMRLPSGPYLQNTQLGWIISGPIGIKRDLGTFRCNFSLTIENQLRKFWELEELPTPCDTRTEEERHCENHFVTTTTRNGDGRFCVQIPLKSSAQSLGETYPNALTRFLSLEKRLQRAPEYKGLYSDFMHEYLALGHMTRIESYASPNFFMPHHGVLREQRSTTKLRVVFDASAASSTGVSFNDIQLVGPPIQGDLLGILLRLRLHKYIACADVEKMYRQVEVTADQRDLQLILWRDNPMQPVGVYKHNRIVYGTASAAFLAVRCLKETAAGCVDPEVKRIINEDFFVDDMITGHDDKDTLLKLCENTFQVLQSGCFPLRKWIFNFECDQFSTRLHDRIKPLNLDQETHCKTLGIGWNNSTDELHYSTQFKINNSSEVTKRTILSHVSQIFDPFGLLSPTIIIAKIMLQKTWLLGVGWDDALPHDVTHAWNRFAMGLSELDRLRIPRRITKHSYERIELHIFTDASQAAYGACAYIRTLSNIDGKEDVHVRLLCSKGKVAPLKPVSIPRLELCAALLGARLYTKIRDSLYCHFNDVVFWTDSTVVLGWLRMSPHLLKTFVQNRVAEIHEITKELPWQHISGNHNPADLVSRGVSLPHLISSRLWWKGPLFLHDSYTNPTDLNEGSEFNVTQDIPEVKSHAVNVVLAEQGVELFPFSRFSQYERMRRALAYVLRFINNTRINKTDREMGELTLDELNRAEIRLGHLSQLESFREEFNLVSKDKSLRHKPSLSKLNLFVDCNNLIRVGGRISNSEHFDYEQKHPVLLCSKHRFSVLLMRYEHQRLLHAAPQALLYNIRQRWWLIGGRNLARKIVHECVTCKRLKGKTLSPIMGNLPKERLTPTYPFRRSGVDYAGPVFILNRKGRGARAVKAYICLFVCFVTRAVHLELVSDLSTEAYILTLKRFISRRGKPDEIFSDNAKNFVGAKNELAKFLTTCATDIVDYAASQAINFKFIPCYAAHFGGLWEAGVKSCKLHLARVIGNAHLTFEEFTTVLTQVEAILNSRPLSPLSSDPYDFLPLSPGHFLVGRPLTSPVYQDMRNETRGLLNRYQRVEQIRHHFWSRWAKEYVSELQTRCRWRENGDSLQPNTMVVIKDDKLPPLKWKIGRIISTVVDKEGVSRVADIRTGSGAIVRRAFSKICPLFKEDDA